MALVVAATASAQVTKSTVNVTMPNCGLGPPTITYQADVYRPTSGGPFPLVAIGHGFQNSRANHEQFGRALAGQGIAVIVPQFPTGLACGSTDHERNALILRAALDQQIAAGGIDTSRVGLAGHSAGGLSAFLAASQRDVQAVFLMDATDVNGLGLAAAPNVAEPTLWIHAEPGTCNSQGNSTQWFMPKPGPKGRFKIVNGSHCEPQDPVNTTCTLGCGGSAAYVPMRAAMYQAWGLAFFGRYLLGRTAPCLDDTAQAEATAGRIAAVDFRFGGCPASDGGMAPVDGGAAPTDGGVRPDAGLASDGGQAPVTDAGVGPPEDAGAPGDEDAGLLPTFDGGDIIVRDGGDDLGAPDAGMEPPVVPPAGCDCQSAPGALLALLGLTLAARRRSARLV
jgi:MYXO-CTERM domain-containing protein